MEAGTVRLSDDVTSRAESVLVGLCQFHYKGQLR